MSASIIQGQATRECSFLGECSSGKKGRRHDKRLLDKHDVVRHMPGAVTVWADTGFQGLQHQHQPTMMPQKAKKNQPLLPEQKQENKLISGLRVVVEHARSLASSVLRVWPMSTAIASQTQMTTLLKSAAVCGTFTYKRLEHLQLLHQSADFRIRQQAL